MCAADGKYVCANASHSATMAPSFARINAANSMMKLSVISLAPEPGTLHAIGARSKYGPNCWTGLTENTGKLELDPLRLPGTQGWPKTAIVGSLAGSVSFFGEAS